MKRSAMEHRLLCSLGSHSTPYAMAVIDNLVGEGSLPPFDSEEPEGFKEWYRKWYPTYEPDRDLEGDEMDRVFALACWNACLAHQEARGRTISPEADPEVRRKEIEAQIEAWADIWFGPNAEGWRCGVALAARLGVL
jgi:hypothetical protein